ncbi:hypothetical protein MNBD_CHLOROFLEXI01-2403, partial [hydrothermal vent metagenome]
MQEQKQENIPATTAWGVNKVVLETALFNAFVHHAIDNRGILTSPRRGRQVATQMLEEIEKFLAFEADEADIALFASLLAEQGMAIVTGTQMMHALLPLLQNAETAVILRLNSFQIHFLEKLANAREGIQQRYQETAQAALQRALHEQLDQQTSLHEAQKQRNDNLNQILHLNAHLSQINDKATLLREAVNGMCVALNIAHVTLFEAAQSPKNWRVITTTAPFLTQ